MEPASMLGGEPFSDRPQLVAPAIAAFLRCYNDRLDDRRRQDLYEYAAKVVGSVSTAEVEAARVERLLQWADERRTRRVCWSPLARFRAKPESADRTAEPEAAGVYAARSIRRVSDETHAEVLAMVDGLIELGTASGDIFGDVGRRGRSRQPDASGAAAGTVRQCRSNRSTTWS